MSYIDSKLRSKLDKLRAFIERDCGNESHNALRAIERLMKKHGLTKADYSYTWWEDKQREEQAQEQARRSQYGYGSDFDYHRVSYTSMMKQIVIRLAKQMGLRIVKRRGKSNELHIYCNATQWAHFEHALDKVKAEWKYRMSIIEDEMFDWVDLNYCKIDEYGNEI